MSKEFKWHFYKTILLIF